MDNQVLGKADICEDVVRVDEEDSHGTRRAHKRQSILNCPAGFTTAIPGDQHILAQPVWPTAGIGHEQHRPAARKNGRYNPISWSGIRWPRTTRSAQCAQRATKGSVKPIAICHSPRRDSFSSILSNLSPTAAASSGTTPIR